MYIYIYLYIYIHMIYIYIHIIEFHDCPDPRVLTADISDPDAAKSPASRRWSSRRRSEAPGFLESQRGEIMIVIISHSHQTFNHQ
jgi:hypothetical protein